VSRTEQPGVSAQSASRLATRHFCRFLKVCKSVVKLFCTRLYGASSSPKAVTSVDAGIFCRSLASARSRLGLPAAGGSALLLLLLDFEVRGWLAFISTAMALALLFASGWRGAGAWRCNVPGRSGC
jgi:hypothetical protein